MRSLACAVLLSAALAIPSFCQKPAAGFDGRWDLTIKTPTDTYPSWLEITGQQVRIGGRESSVHPANDVKLEGNKLTFSSKEWLNKNIPVEWQLTAANGKLTGVQKRSDGINGQISGVPAPALKRPMPAAWGTPVALFNGKDLTGWEPYVIPGKKAANHWKAINGELVNEAAGANIRTKGSFQDFKLHLEYNCPQDGNSGVYLRGRYEIQVDYEPNGTNDAAHSMGAIYGFLAPSTKLPAKPGQWESFDVTLVGRMVTIVRNGTTLIDNQEIPGITGGALDSHEDQPGPLLIQGDHTGGMKYRNITIATAKK